MNFNKFLPQIYLSIASILLCFVFWFGFYFNIPGKMGFPATTLETVFANYDGPNYMVVSKCGYDKKCIASHFSLPQPLEYYPAHLPGFPFLIKYFGYYTTTPKAMLLVSLIGSILFSIASYQFFLLFLKQKSAFYLTLFSLFFPARMLSLRLVGAPETLYMALTLFSIITFKKNRYLLSALLGALALTLKSPGILLFFAYGIVFIQQLVTSKKVNFNFAWYLLIPVTALAIFYLYFLQTGDFWAYFHSGDNIHLNILPYLVFISNHTWINTIWLEDVVYIYLIAFYGINRLIKKYRYDIIVLFPLIYTLAAVFVAHRDISRYVAPVYPFLILAFSRFLQKKSVRLIFILLLPAILLYTINFIIGNVAPVADWTPYL